MENKDIPEFADNKRLKIFFLLFSLILAMLYVYYNFWGIENAPNRYSGYTPPTLFDVVSAIPFFPAGLLNLMGLFQIDPDNDYASIPYLIIAPFLWIIYVFLGALFVFIKKKISYLFLGVFVLVLIFNVSGCQGMGL
ncbi:MAG: hypothetical protein J0M11_04420 [Anaerolineae bacterium]|nr:hypothetical protein [Anaerolineae bacterium]